MAKLSLTGISINQWKTLKMHDLHTLSYTVKIEINVRRWLMLTYCCWYKPPSLLLLANDHIGRLKNTHTHTSNNQTHSVSQTEGKNTQTFSSLICFHSTLWKCRRTAALWSFQQQQQQALSFPLSPWISLHPSFFFSKLFSPLSRHFHRTVHNEQRCCEFLFLS